MNRTGPSFARFARNVTKSAKQSTKTPQGTSRSYNASKNSTGAKQKGQNRNCTFRNAHTETYARPRNVFDNPRAARLRLASTCSSSPFKNISLRMNSGGLELLLDSVENDDEDNTNTII